MRKEAARLPERQTPAAAQQDKALKVAREAFRKKNTNAVATASKEEKRMPPKRAVPDNEALFTADEKSLVQRLQTALDNENLKEVLEASEVAAGSKRPEIRQQAVSALGWFGVMALPELTRFLDDEEDDIAADALREFEAALDEIEDDAQKAGLIEAAMRVLPDAEALEQIAMGLNSMPNGVALQTLINVIGSGNEAAVGVARESYEFITGEPYKDLDTANKWLAENPDE